MTVSKDLMANLLLAAGGRSVSFGGGGGSNKELTNWDGIKKKRMKSRQLISPTDSTDGLFSTCLTLLKDKKGVSCGQKSSKLDK